MTGMLIGYARVPTNDQDLPAQKKSAWGETVERAGYRCDAIERCK
ncbi:hypothetical protein [Cryobacterium sp. Y57]|nr:hypothetical protein [Cryobacterium sp. Y57]